MMIDCILPDGWGLIEESDRGDILTAYLLDDQGNSVASIFWMSKGSYDNEATISKYDKKKLDVSKCTLVDGYWKINRDQERENFDALYAEYLRMPNYGTDQVTINDRYAKLLTLNKDYIETIPQLQQSRNNIMQDTLFNVQQGCVTLSHYIATDIPWIN